MTAPKNDTKLSVFDYIWLSQPGYWRSHQTINADRCKEGKNKKKSHQERTTFSVNVQGKGQCRITKIISKITALLQPAAIAGIHLYNFSTLLWSTVICLNLKQLHLLEYTSIYIHTVFYTESYSISLCCYCCCCLVTKSCPTLWTVACQASLSFTISLGLLKLLSIELMIPSNHLILCCPLLLLPSVFPTTGVFSNKSALHIR